MMDFNQESFVTLPSKTAGGIPRYFSVPVIHDFLFDNNCNITQMTLFQDPYTVVAVYAGYPATTSPIMPFIVFNSPPNSFVTSFPSNDFQVFPGEVLVPGAAALNLVKRYYATVSTNNGNLTESQANEFFMSTNFAVPQAYSALLVPGDSLVLPYAGMFMAPQEVWACVVRASIYSSCGYLVLRACVLISSDCSCSQPQGRICE